MNNYSREEGFTANSVVTVCSNTNKVFYDHSTIRNPNGLVLMDRLRIIKI